MFFAFSIVVVAAAAAKQYLSLMKFLCFRFPYLFFDFSHLFLWFVPPLCSSTMWIVRNYLVFLMLFIYLYNFKSGEDRYNTVVVFRVDLSDFMPNARKQRKVVYPLLFSSFSFFKLTLFELFFFFLGEKINNKLSFSGGTWNSRFYHFCNWF